MFKLNPQTPAGKVVTPGTPLSVINVSNRRVEFAVPATAKVCSATDVAIGDNSL